MPSLGWNRTQHHKLAKHLLYPPTRYQNAVGSPPSTARWWIIEDSEDRRIGAYQTLYSLGACPVEVA